MSTLGRLVGDMLRRSTEYGQGRIYSFSNTWVWADSPMVKSAKATRFRHADPSGREMVLVGSPGVHCPNPEIGRDYPLSDGAEKGHELRWFVPAKVCRACEHRRKAQRGINYPWCAWAAAQRGGRAAGALRVLGMASQAMQDANHLIEHGTLPPEATV
jgi:hypothetical protein